MTSTRAPPVPLSQVGRAAHDLGLAGLLGGNLFGRLALRPERDRDQRQAERGRWSTLAGAATATVNRCRWSPSAAAAGGAGGRGAPGQPVGRRAVGRPSPRTCSSASWPSRASHRGAGVRPRPGERTAPCRSGRRSTGGSSTSAAVGARPAAAVPPARGGADRAARVRPRRRRRHRRGLPLPAVRARARRAGFHLHFVSADRTTGGHVLSCRPRDVLVRVDHDADLDLELPPGVQAAGRRRPQRPGAPRTRRVRLTPPPAPPAPPPPPGGRPPRAPARGGRSSPTREPRKTRATGPTVLDPTTSTSPSSHSMSSSASSHVSPYPTTASSDGGFSGRSRISSSASRAARSMSSTHWRTTVVLGSGPDPGGERCPRAHGEGGQAQRGSDAGGDAGRREHEVVGLVGPAERGRHPLHLQAGLAVVAARGEGDRHRRAVHQPVGDAAQRHPAERPGRGRAEHDGARRVALGQLDQSRRAGAGLDHQGRDRDVPLQPGARRVQRLVRRALQVGAVLRVHTGGTRRPRHREDRAEQDVLAARPRQHPREVDLRPAAALGREADDHRHGAPSSAARRLPSVEWLRL